MPANYSALIARFEKGIQLVENAVKALPPNEIDVSPAPGKWNVRQIMAHLTDAEVVAAMRFRLIAAEPGSRLSPFDQDKWAENLAYGKQPLAESLAAFSALRRHTAQMLRNLPEGAWSHIAVHEERGPTSLEAYVEYICNHAETHVGQIVKIREKLSGKTVATA